MNLQTSQTIASPLTVSPASLFIGNLDSAASVTKQLVVRARKPFSITAIECDDKRFEFVSANDEKKALHFVPVKFVGDGTSGKIVQTIKIKTDLGITATCTATATLSEPAAK